MKALTICQPYAELIIRGDKLVENRRWPTRYQGLLLIHAGKSRDWLRLDDSGQVDAEYGLPLAEMAFGAIVGMVRLRACLRLETITGPRADVRWEHLRHHEHTEGPYCWVLEEPKRFERPVPFRGAQGLFDVPFDTIQYAIDAARRTG